MFSIIRREFDLTFCKCLVTVFLMLSICFATVQCVHHKFANQIDYSFTSECSDCNGTPIAIQVNDTEILALNAPTGNCTTDIQCVWNVTMTSSSTRFWPYLGAWLKYGTTFTINCNNENANQITYMSYVSIIMNFSQQKYARCDNDQCTSSNEIVHMTNCTSFTVRYHKLSNYQENATASNMGLIAFAVPICQPWQQSVILVKYSTTNKQIIHVRN
jgi:hypothetical protein